MPTDLLQPQPDEAGLVHSQQLSDLIRREIDARGGWMDFADYMRLALYAPGLGYYSSGTEKFGPAGDFITAAELGPAFARCIGRWLAPLLRQCARPCLMEIGAGSGAVAAELLSAAADGAFELAEYQILEVSADLRERQRATLTARVPQCLPRVEWLDRLPKDFGGLVIANEVMDALPVSRFAVTASGVRALGVRAEAKGFTWAEAQAPPTLRKAVAEVLDPDSSLPVGYRSEVSLELGAWINSLAAMLSQGAILLADYGCSRREYYRPERTDGSLICHYRHHAHDNPFLYPGLQDISAWVDFTRVALSGQAAGLTLAGYTTQAHFLLANGLEQEMQSVTSGTELEQLRMSQALRRLLLPGEMGENFKVMVFSRNMQLDDLQLGRDLSSRL